MSTADGIYFAENVSTGRVAPEMFRGPTPWRDELPADAPPFPMAEVRDGHIVAAVDWDGARWEAAS